MQGAGPEQAGRGQAEGKRGARGQANEAQGAGRGDLMPYAVALAVTAAGCSNQSRSFGERVLSSSHRVEQEQRRRVGREHCQGLGRRMVEGVLSGWPAHHAVRDASSDLQKIRLL